ncbi:MAG TPA: 3-phosphoshikimate 1-carboxyvinyltransferase [Dehalococcoidia bacterium]|nr:3-phosphoshikimate 1-carboxyvinyltransferase [Dehalococcoidia bacterium]
MERTIRPARRLRGTIAVPGDKSISHRAAILNALAGGEAVVHNFLPGDDCRSTLRVLQALGVDCALDEHDDAPMLRVRGGGLHGLREPGDVLDCGNSGTTMRLLAGVLAGQPFHAVLTGDASLRTRPMARVTRPLAEMGARIDGREGGRLAPLAVRGGGLRGIHYRPPEPSAQVKSAVLLAGLYAEGETVVEEAAPTRDHTERMLAAMGARIAGEGGAVRLTPGVALAPLSMRVPNDISAAAFWMVAAAAHPDAEVRLTGVGLNPTRTGIIDALHEMGADLAIEEERIVGGEPVGDVVVRSSRLRGIEVAGDLVPRLIDEVPALAVAAACADGETIVRDAKELRVKESDRIATVAAELRRLGARVEERDDGMRIEGGTLAGGAVASHGDHRLAMALAAAGLVARGPTRLSDAGAVTISYPDFWEHLERFSAAEDAP